MLDYVVTDIQKDVLRGWLESRPAYIAVAPANREVGERDFWHIVTSSNTLTTTDLHLISAYWAGAMTFNPDGAVSRALATRLSPSPTHFHLA